MDGGFIGLFIGTILMFVLYVYSEKDRLRNIEKKLNNKIDEKTEESDRWWKRFKAVDEEIKDLKFSFPVLVKKKYINDKNEISKIESFNFMSSDLDLNSAFDDSTHTNFLENNLSKVSNLEYFKNGKKIKELFNTYNFNEDVYGTELINKSYKYSDLSKVRDIDNYEDYHSVLIQYEKEKIIKKIYENVSRKIEFLDSNGVKFNPPNYEHITKLFKNKQVTEIFRFTYHYSEQIKKILSEKCYELFDENGKLTQFKAFEITNKKEELYRKIDFKYKNSLLVEEIEYAEEDEEDEEYYEKKTKYIYNNKNQLIKETIFERGLYNTIRLYWYDKASFEVVLNEVKNGVPDFRAVYTSNTYKKERIQYKKGEIRKYKNWQVLMKELLFLNVYNQMNGYDNTKNVIEFQVEIWERKQDDVSFIVEKEIKE